jgi:hypothetical protein
MPRAGRTRAEALPSCVEADQFRCVDPGIADDEPVRRAVGDAGEAAAYGADQGFDVGEAPAPRRTLVEPDPGRVALEQHRQYFEAAGQPGRQPVSEGVIVASRSGHLHLRPVAAAVGGVPERALQSARQPAAPGAGEFDPAVDRAPRRATVSGAVKAAFGFDAGSVLGVDHHVARAQVREGERGAEERH